MRFIDGVCAAFTVVVKWLTFSNVDASGGRPYPITAKLDLLQHAYHQTPYEVHPSLEYEMLPEGGPSFKPPTGRIESDLKCEYPSLGTDWVPCSEPSNRKCWLKNKRTSKEYNIETNYEDVSLSGTPPGIVRNYTIVLGPKSVNADGIDFPYGKVFNDSFPGPWLQACWGDTLNVTVINNLPADDKKFSNGTSIHWHGLRLLNRTQFDGVNGVTQCPIAPGDYFVYTINVTQYGSTWYHSHYSMQYADGAQGPITLHGPSSADWDEPKSPLIMTDWGHNTAFQAAFPAPPGPGLLLPSIVLNGKGNVNNYRGDTINTSVIPDPYQITFQPGKRYLMRLINTAFDAPFQFSIDEHELQIVQADLVPIEPFTTNKITLNIGQRYNVVVKALDANKVAGGKSNFWIRTNVCGGKYKPPPTSKNADRTGIVRYDLNNKGDPNSTPYPPDLTCVDVGRFNLVPKVKWNIGPSANNTYSELTRNGKNKYPLGALAWNLDVEKKKPAYFFQIDYAKPIFLRFQDPKPDEAEVVVLEDFTDKDWVYLVLISSGHPIHLHGHDFAIVYDSQGVPFNPSDMKETCPNNKKFRCDNPARRDVVTPGPGYTVIAFKTDNPGSWLMHCHIARHAGEGLALQILERRKDAAALWPPGERHVVEAQRVCKNWNTYWTNIKIEQDDSGI